MKILWFIEDLSLGGLQTQSINLIREISETENMSFKKKADVIISNLKNG